MTRITNIVNNWTQKKWDSWALFWEPILHSERLRWVQPQQFGDPPGVGQVPSLRICSHPFTNTYSGWRWPWLVMWSGVSRIVVVYSYQLRRCIIKCRPVILSRGCCSECESGRSEGSPSAEYSLAKDPLLLGTPFQKHRPFENSLKTRESLTGFSLNLNLSLNLKKKL